VLRSYTLSIIDADVNVAAGVAEALLRVSEVVGASFARHTSQRDAYLMLIMLLLA